MNRLQRISIGITALLLAISRILNAYDFEDVADDVVIWIALAIAFFMFFMNTKKGVDKK